MGRGERSHEMRLMRGGGLNFEGVGRGLGRRGRGEGRLEGHHERRFEGRLIRDTLRGAPRGTYSCFNHYIPIRVAPVRFGYGLGVERFQRLRFSVLAVPLRRGVLGFCVSVQLGS